MRISIYYVFALCMFIANAGFGQVVDDCECEDDIITICYLAEADYCVPNQYNGCGYSFDGFYIEDLLVPKLLNLNNFGQNGKVGCPIEAFALQDVSSVEAIISQNCDIIFTGNFVVDTLTLEIDQNVTTIPTKTLEIIKTWSQICQSNLVITSQQEASVWGYDVKNQNVNPNNPSPEASSSTIFDGPFGVVNSFNQGGSYQGVILITPPSGSTVLAVDANGKPTVVIDALTNDIIAGDIGIFCGNGVGQVSEGELILNNNDRFVCNIFALGCSIANPQYITTNNYVLCPGQEVVGPQGDIFSLPGIYRDTLQASNNCDSIVITDIEYQDTLVNNATYLGCKGDGYSVVLNNTLYNESNPTGEENLLSADGCDSLIVVDLVYFNHTVGSIISTFCANNPEEYIVGNKVFNADNPSGQVLLTNANGCDSLVTIQLTELLLDTTFIVEQLCDYETFEVDGIEYTPPSLTSLLIARPGKCDSVLILELLSYPPLPEFAIPTNIEIVSDTPYQFDLDIDPQYTISWSPSAAVSCSNCPDPIYLSESGIQELGISITDAFGCSAEYSISIKITCPVFVSNILAAQESGENGTFKVYSRCNFDVFQLAIYDKWGNKVFSSKDQLRTWDGTFNGKQVGQGVYVYTLSYTAFGITKNQTGDITIVR